MMYILDSSQTLMELTLTQFSLILKYAIHIICILLPIILIILWTSDILKKVFDPKDISGTIKIMAYRLCCALIIFFIPTIVKYSTTLINGYNDTFVTKYYEEASLEKVNLLKKQHENELKAEKNQTQLDLKEAEKEQQEKQQKRNELLEELDKNFPQNNPTTGTYDSSGEQNGTYGSVKYENGVFYIPNRRATSDNDIPKQSGSYGLNPIFWERLNKLIQDASSQGYKVTVTSGWRSYSSQRSLWDKSNRACSERGKWVACPGGSRHGFGIAADLSFNGSSCSGGWDCNAAAKWVHANAGKYGLTFRMSWEPWHIEPDQIKGGSFGSCNASC